MLGRAGYLYQECGLYLRAGGASMAFKQSSEVIHLYSKGSLGLPGVGKRDGGKQNQREGCGDGVRKKR